MGYGEDSYYPFLDLDTVEAANYDFSASSFDYSSRNSSSSIA